ncbi:PBSP domain-containing protein [Aspergillus sp. HF37]|nr:PBSP domain-containing protein [Aspergillus sp. HF37]
MTATSETPALPSAIPRNQTQETPNPKPQDAPANTPKPKLRLHINDLRHPATKSFLTLLPDPCSTLETALAAIIQHLYTPHLAQDLKKPPVFTPAVPPTRSVTLILHDFAGVAYTTGTDLDDDHKEIHFSLSYIRTCASYKDPVGELAGVLTHELVHCYQHTTPPSSPDDVPRPPGGLVEGVADFVRLKAGLEPPHWKRPASAKDRPQNWDQGYQHTAFFLTWLEDVRIGRGAVGMLNDRLRTVGYVGEDTSSMATRIGFWKGLFGAGVSELWHEYGRYLDGV